MTSSYITSTPSCIFLVGMPGSGKSSVGKVLAAELGYQFLDLDTLLEEQEGLSIAEVFAQKGQAYFRQAEAKALRRVKNLQENVILATGGGAPCFHDNMAFMLDAGLAVYLKVAPQELVTRLTETDLQVRPLLRDKSPQELLAFLAETLTQRALFYAQAPVILEVDGLSVAQAAQALVPLMQAGR
ncbi:shikimate kinase [Rufibacter sp. LB8]|uniref:shikimate kinase n=1 Tax=Rufibacter sp. LB8 TaxID=2777781 RepID=UPI00178C8133|nr:shikimate kinase [Rufibacter sp. LB8]